MSRLPLAEFDAAILVGGLGTRLREVVGELPKPLAPVLGRPFLFYLLDMLALRGARSVTLCCGYRADLVTQNIGASWMGMPVRYSIENEPLGTGGALGLAACKMESDLILAMNGDSWFEPDWLALREIAARFTTTIAAVRVENSSRYGTLQSDPASGRVEAFLERQPDAPSGGFINSGVYLCDRNWLVESACKPCSLERDLFPALAESRRLGACAGDGPFLDIGIPSDYERAPDFFRQIGIAPHSMFPDFPDMTNAAVKLGACVLIRDEAGRILFERRADCGWWCLPGGKLDPGETLEQCAEREALEETGLRVKLNKLLGIFSDPTRRTVRYPDNGDLRQLVDAAYLATLTDGAIQKSPESLDLQWFYPHEIPLNTVPPVVEILRKNPDSFPRRPF